VTLLDGGAEWHGFFASSLALLWCVSSYRKALLGIFHLFRATKLPYFWD
jgi:hypothetical protein